MYSTVILNLHTFYIGKIRFPNNVALCYIIRPSHQYPAHMSAPHLTRACSCSDSPCRKSREGRLTYQIHLVKVHLDLSVHFNEVHSRCPVQLLLSASLHLILYRSMQHEFVGVAAEREDLHGVVGARRHLFPHAFAEREDFCRADQYMVLSRARNARYGM
jgi:hypothetical protein